MSGGLQVMQVPPEPAGGEITSKADGPPAGAPPHGGVAIAAPVSPAVLLARRDNFCRRARPPTHSTPVQVAPLHPRPQKLPTATFSGGGSGGGGISLRRLDHPLLLITPPNIAWCFWGGVWGARAAAA